MDWEITPTAITIEQGGPAPGCVVVGLFIIGASILAFGTAVYMEMIDIPLENTLPIVVFSGGFGLFWWLAIPGSRRNTLHTVVTIDTFNNMVRYHDDTGRSKRASRGTSTPAASVATDPDEIVIPFADLEALVVHETVTKHTTSTSSNSGRPSSTRTTYTYDYRVYLVKKDGSIFWLYTFRHKKDAVEHLKVLLERVAVSCIDEAKAGLARTVQNPYRAVSRQIQPVGTSPSVEISEKDGEQRIILRKSRSGVRTFFAYILLIGIFIGVPVWFYVANQPEIPGWFLIIPAVPALGMLVGMVVLGRKYIILCGRDELTVSVRFWFPLLQILLGRTVRIPASAMRGVRVNRYEGTEFHLELIVDKEVKLPRLTGLSFNTGAIRMLPRSCIPDESRHIGLWSVFPTGRGNKGPQVSDLYAIEGILQTKYTLENDT